MPKTGFKYCALHYLNQWISKDRACCEALAGPRESEKLRTLADVAVFYRIARNLPKCYDEGKGILRYRPVLRIIDDLNPAEFQGDKLLRSIKKVRDKISAQYGGREVLSLTTKFLWLKMKSPIIIYDRQARKAVGVAPGKIDEYYSMWREKFNGYDQQIQDACTSLPTVHEYAENPETATPEYIAKTAAAQLALVLERGVLTSTFGISVWMPNRCGSRRVVVREPSRSTTLPACRKPRCREARSYISCVVFRGAARAPIRSGDRADHGS